MNEKRKRKTWTNRMVEKLAAMKRAGMASAAIAERLGVSVDAVHAKAKRLGARSALRNKRGARPKRGLLCAPLGVACLPEEI